MKGPEAKKTGWQRPSTWVWAALAMLLVTVVALSISSEAWAQPQRPGMPGGFGARDALRDGMPGPPAAGRADRPSPFEPGHLWRYDDRFQHGRYYPAPGFKTLNLPLRSMSIAYHGDHYYLDDGVWFHDAGRGYVVTSAPVGALVPVLPLGCTTLMVGSIQYYYANDVYYAGAVASSGYVVVDPPEGATPTVVDRPVDSNAELQVYPAGGQSQAQLFSDRADCSRAATDKSGFDPTRPGTLRDAAWVSGRAAYRGVEAQCLAARGYTVR